MQLKRSIQTSIGGLWGAEPTETDEGIAVARVADFAYGELTLTGAPTRRRLPINLVGERVLRPGDLLIETSGGGDRQNVGRVVQWSGHERTVFSNFINVLRPVAGFDSRWLAYLHRHLYLSGVAASCTKQTTGIQNLDLGAYLATQVDVPTRAAQRGVADFLDRECERIAASTRELRRLSLGLHEATSGVFMSLVKSPERTWPLKRFVESIVDGPFGSALASKHYVDEAQVRVIRLGNVGIAEFLDADAAFVSSDYADIRLRQHYVNAGDVILAGLGDAAHPIGRACVVPEKILPAIHKADCYRLVVDSQRAVPEFLAQALSLGPARQVAPLLSRGSTRARLNTIVARDLPIPALSVAEQQELSKTVRSFRAQHASIEAHVSAMQDQLTEYRDALITEAVTGQLDVARLSDRQLDESAHAATEGEQPEVLSA